MTIKTAREQTSEALKTANEAWRKAPIHVKAMASAYVNPLLDAVFTLDREIEALQQRLDVIQCALEVNLGN